MSSQIDITNKKFGNWTAICREEKNLHGQWRWKFRCECGKECVRIPSVLKRYSGKCPHKRKRSGPKPKNLKGRKFGKWTVIGRDPAPDHDSSREIYWLCRCKCGAVKSVKGKHLTAYESLSCLPCSKKLTFGEKLRMERLRAGRTQQEQGDLEGVTKQAVSLRETKDSKEAKKAAEMPESKPANASTTEATLATTPLVVPKNPCSTCPYRKDVPSGVWSAEEYEKLRTYDEPRIGDYDGKLPNLGVFLCHHSSRDQPTICKGFLTVHQDCVAVRLAVLTGSLDGKTYFAEPSTVSLYASGNEAADAGLRDVESPSDEAVKAVAKLVATGKFRTLTDADDKSEESSESK